ncbi:MAG: hypothetical protein SFY32_15970 [Bacteroidota bacterium]|nr:hypothetical protein [Bacteroidota bacterium]
MKKLVKIAAIIAATMLSVSVAFSQNYKAVKIDASGKVTDEKGIVVASVSSDGTITDAKGAVLGKIEGNSLKDKMGMKMGEIMDNGSFKDGSGTVIYTVSAADKDGKCSIMDKSGTLLGTVDKAQLKAAACVMHCLKK